MLSRKLTGSAAGLLAFLILNLHAAATTWAEEPSEEGWLSLFNGKDLDGWDVWLGRPRGQKEPVGLNQDTKGVFRVVEVDGEPAIRVSGEIPGAITSKQEYESYHLRAEFKWGQKNWRNNFPRDGGILFHCVGPHGVQAGAWMESLECEVMAGHCGDFFSVFGPRAEIEVAPQTRKLPYYRNREFHVYQKGGQRITVGKNTRVLIPTDYEQPHGQWNTVEFLTVGGDSVYLVNGKVTMRVSNARRIVDGKEVPLTRGKLQIISEWSELYYRTIALKPLKHIPEKYLN